MRIVLIILAIAVASCRQPDSSRVLCNHTNDRARWQQYPQLTALQYDSLAAAKGWTCTP